MKTYARHHYLARQLSLMPRSLPLNNLRFIGRLFLASILVLWLIWMVDALQQRDVLHLLTGGGRALEEVPVHSTEQGATHAASQTAPKLSAATQAHAAQRALRLPFWLMGVFRIPTLILLGIITPLALFIWNWESLIYSEILNPYLMLLGAQAGSLVVGILLLGEGIVPFLGLVYSSLRVLQINGLLDLRFRASSQMPKPLRLVLRAALALWALNAIALAFHILWVTWRLLKPG